MSSVIERTEITPEELLALPDSKNYELVGGELRERAMGVLTSAVAIRVSSRLFNHVDANQLGNVFDAENGYQCFPDSPKTVRRPDVSFISIERLKNEELGDGWAKIVPDLVVEVLSPNDLIYEVEAKLAEYRRVGVPLIWIVAPPTRSVRVIRRDRSIAEFDAGDILSGEDVVPGFSCRVVDLFPPVTN